MKYKPIYVEWLDAATQAEWTEVKDPALRPAKVYTLGYLVRETDTYLVVSAALSLAELDAEKDEAAANIIVPKGWIKRRKWIKI